MVRRKKQKKPEKKHENDVSPSGPRPFWSGTISFGLVSVPVSLFPAYRHVKKGLRMLDKNGIPLSRRFYCPEHQTEVHSEHILRGYPIDEDEYVIVRDDELEALAPEKSRDIDLTKFVPRDQLPPELFDRAYFLTPDGDSNKAYRLLVEVMQRQDRAGIATFVMRGKEYLIAIIAENGMLRAETLRFADEVRSPETVGLSEVETPSKDAVSKFAKGIKKHRNGGFDRDALHDRSHPKLMQLVEKKYRRKEDVAVAGHAAASEDDAAGGEPSVDLLETIRRSMQQESTNGNGKPHNAKSAGNGSLEKRSKQQLYETAQDLDIAGRNQMSKDQLIRAIRKAQS